MVHRLIWRSLALVLLASAVWVGAASAAMQPWSDVSPSSIPSTGERWIAPDSYRALALDVPALEDFLAAVPPEGTDAASAGRAEISLPLPDGSLGRFSIVESPVMAPELQARYPEIRTYAGYGLDDPSAHVRLDLTPHGFHAQIRSANGSIYIDPYQQNDTVHYQSYLKSDLRSHSMLEGCTVIDEDGMSEEIHRLMGGAQGRSGANLRTYRTAIAATGEYTTFHGGTVPLGLAAVVTALNRVDGVYEDEVAVRMVLVANNDLLIYTNGNTDPYTNNDGYTMLGQNQANIDAVIGSANYDIGHVFSTGGGGIAGLGVVCRAGNKARGVTGLFAPIGDAFYICLLYTSPSPRDS
ncbi:MAG: zinc-dependent metalloprotease family protein, partial [Candidatus Eisenbacteria bacterium]|nr:zinc-dependent metalloprotease family protein [Candidatus Eisenbacteria bacterium]